MIESAKPLGFALFENDAWQCVLSELAWFMDVGCGFSPAHLNQKAGQNAQPTALRSATTFTSLFAVESTAKLRLVAPN